MVKAAIEMERLETRVAIQATTIAKRRAIDAVKDTSMMRVAAVTAADSDPETAAAKKKAGEVELKVDAAVDLKEALVQFESLVAERAALVAEVVAAGARAKVMAASEARAATKAAIEKDAATLAASEAKAAATTDATTKKEATAAEATIQSQRQRQ